MFQNCDRKKLRNPKEHIFQTYSYRKTDCKSAEFRCAYHTRCRRQKRRIPRKKARRKSKSVFSVSDLLKSVAILILASCIGMLFRQLGVAEANIITVYVLGVLVTSVVTRHRVYSLMSSIVSVLVFNFFFTDPQFTLRAYNQGYPVTFLIMFLAALLTSSLAVKLKEHAKQSAKSAYRTKVLFDTNQLLQQAKDKNEIVSATANQLIKLLGKDIVFYLTEGETLGEPHIFTVSGDKTDKEITGTKEEAVAEWVLKNNKHAGATTETLSNAKCLYLAVRVNSQVYGVVGIYIGDEPLDAFKKSILLSILGECALSLENEKNAREKEEAAISLMKRQRISFIQIFTMTLCGLSILWATPLNTRRKAPIF